jgi:hypothetical protein
MASVAIHARPSRSTVVQVLQSAALPVEDLTDDHMEHFFYAASASRRLASWASSGAAHERTSAEEFFRGLGYASADRANAPEEIRATHEFASICPAGSAFMFKQL